MKHCSHLEETGARCNQEGLSVFDRHGIFSGYACDRHYGTLPGQGRMWDYQPERGEAIDPDEDVQAADDLADLNDALYGGTL